MTNPTLKTDSNRVNLSPDIEPEGEPWRTMESEDALAYLVDADAAQRTLEGRRAASRLGLVGIANKRRLVAWRRENQLCPKCGRALPADEPFKHCPRCRRSFREHQRHVNANMTEPQRLARNERARRSYHKLANGKPAPPKRIAEVVAPMVAEVVAPMVAEVVAPMVAEVVAPTGPKRDRAAYFRAYRAAKANREAEAKS